jgi:hypothetical protein
MCQFCKIRNAIEAGDTAKALVGLDDLQRDYDSAMNCALKFLKVADASKVPVIDLARFEASVSSVAGYDVPVREAMQPGEPEMPFNFTVISPQPGESIADAIVRALGEGMGEHAPKKPH